MDNNKLLEENGWEIHCESPFEIYHSETESHVNGHYAVSIIIDDLKREEDYEAMETRIASYLRSKFDQKNFNKIVKEKAIKYADTLHPNTPNNMEDEHQWHIVYDAFEKGAKSLVDPENY